MTVPMTIHHSFRRKTQTGVISTDWGGSSNISDLLCPGCGSPYLHSGTVTTFDRDEDADLVIRTTANGTNSQIELVPSGLDNPSDRRNGVVIQFECEGCDCRPELQIAQHKGNTHVSWLFTKQDDQK